MAVYWSAVWVGTLAALAVALITGLVGIAVGAHLVGPGHQLEDWTSKHFSIGALVFSVLGAFLAFAAGGWVAGKTAGIKLSEPAILHGAIVWALAVPFLVAFAGLGAGQRGLERQIEGSPVHDREHARHADADRARGRVRRQAEFRAAPANSLVRVSSWTCTSRR